MERVASTRRGCFREDWRTADETPHTPSHRPRCALLFLRLLAGLALVCASLAIRARGDTVPLRAAVASQWELPRVHTKLSVSQLDGVRRVNGNIESLAAVLSKDLAHSLAPLAPNMSGLTRETVDATLRDQRIVVIGDSTTNYFSMFGLFPVMNLFQHAPDTDMAQDIDAIWETIEAKRLVNVTGAIWDREILLPWYNTTIIHMPHPRTEGRRGRPWLCTLLEHSGELWHEVHELKATILIFNVGLHLFHMLPNRQPEECAERLWANLEEWLLDDFVVNTQFVPTRMFISTVSVNDDAETDEWAAAQKIFAHASDKAGGEAAQKLCNLSNDTRSNRAFCMNATMSRHSSVLLTARVKAALSETDVYILPYNTLTREINGTKAKASAGHRWVYDGRHHRPGFGGALTLTRTRLLVDLLGAVQREHQNGSATRNPS